VGTSDRASFRTQQGTADVHFIAKQNWRDCLTIRLFCCGSYSCFSYTQAAVTSQLRTISALEIRRCRVTASPRQKVITSKPLKSLRRTHGRTWCWPTYILELKAPQAEAESTKALELEPNNPRTHTTLATAYRAQSKFGPAEAQGRAAVALAPADAEYRLGSIWEPSTARPASRRRRDPRTSSRARAWSRALADRRRRSRRRSDAK
jgi:hypothetical protein